MADEADTRGVEPTVWGWWHHERAYCNHLAEERMGLCHRESGEWEPLVKKAAYDAEVAKRREAERQGETILAMYVAAEAEVQRLRAALELIASRRDDEWPHVIAAAALEQRDPK